MHAIRHEISGWKSVTFYSPIDLSYCHYITPAGMTRTDDDVAAQGLLESNQVKTRGLCLFCFKSCFSIQQGLLSMMFVKASTRSSEQTAKHWSV